MPCCKAEKFGNWCKEEVLFEHEGKEYCVFHLPHESEDKPEPDDFNKLVFNRITQANANAKPCDLSGTDFPGGISFQEIGQAKELPSIRLVCANFNDYVYFVNVKMKQKIEFHGANFFGSSVFDSSVFQGDANFNEAHFYQNVSFKGVTFEKFAIFEKAKFEKKVSFFKSNFMMPAFFAMTSCKADIDFSFCTFTDIAVFTFGKFRGNALFYWAKFNGRSNFKLTNFYKYASFRGSYFSESAFFHNANFENADFRESEFDKSVYFHDSEFGKAKFDFCSCESIIQFDRANLTCVSFLGAPIEVMLFVDCKWPKKSKRNAIWDDLKREPEIKESRLADLYRRLKKKAKEEHDESLAGDWHYWEKEMYRKSRELGLERILLTLYRLFSGYGESWGRAFTVLLLISLIPILLDLYVKFGWDLFPQQSLAATLKEIFPGDPFSYIPFAKIKTIEKPTYWQKAFSVFWQVLVSAQAALFLFALRNRFRR